ncbi:LPS export ABC transporter periplasmic protein LptC [Proteiniphilum acetatigenes]|uniref:LPS export ABC transporter periplasmic protein LptC n=1 Tax=Proteiniphilum acetatigenes TaxID=294710 RepID=UPI0004778BDB|nr:LPS export ABC transporter periplasmic protein LptC [Proteiniphilum acetatigenes]SFL16502.1 LPS export ABC transporter protein LptC [Porphyromonadaceae bacterium KH3CP3RA]
MLRRHRYIKYLWRITITVSVVVMSLFSCKDKNDNLIAFAYDPDTVPTMITTSVSQLISDSGITRYRIVADVWMVFDQAKEPYWYFPEGLYFEQFTPDFEIEATVEADTAWYYNTKDLWRLKKNVHVENRKGEQFDSDELFWDGKNGKVFSEAYIEIKSGLTELKGYGFESNQTMTDYRIFRPHDGKLPFSETTPADSIQSDSGEVSEAENLMPETE